MDIPLSFRVSSEKDLAFIYHNWLGSYRFNNTIHPQVFFFEHRRVLDRLIRKSQSLILCNPEDPDHIYGFAFYELDPLNSIIHYIYVKPAYRNLGMAKKLIEMMGLDLDKRILCSHLTPISRKLRKQLNALFNPYLLLG